jgi:hypothetical protein
VTTDPLPEAKRANAVSNNWFYMKGADKHGPVSSQRLKELVQSGQLLPTDLVWRVWFLNPCDTTRSVVGSALNGWRHQNGQRMG